MGKERRQKMQELERRRKLWKLEYLSGLEAAKEEGKAEGEAKGKTEGKAEGEAKGIIRTLTKRFESVPAEFEEKLRAITDLVRLDELADFAFDCSTLDEFEAALE